MYDVLKRWYQRHFTDPQAVILVLLLLGGGTVVVMAGHILAPILVSMVFAYLLDGGVLRLTRLGLPRLAAVLLVMLAFLAVTVAGVFVVAPLISQQVTQLVMELPSMISQGQRLLLQLPERYPQFISEANVTEIMGSIRTEVTELGQEMVKLSLSSAQHVFTVFIYLIVVPLMIFFMLKDKEKILHWFERFMPADRRLAGEVWGEVHQKIGSYVRGKALEILIVWAASFLTFNGFGLDYAILLSFLVGLSVVVPYIGAAAVTVPVALVAYFQFGLSAQFGWVMGVYAIIQFLDGNVLVPVLFSEVVNLHPVAIIAAVFIFGGIWGLVGVFFAIPLATLVNAVINSWPTTEHPPAHGMG